MQNTFFNHSVKVPKLYKCAAKISQEVAGGGGSIKQLVYEKKHFNTKALYALVITTFQKAKEIDLLLKRTKLLEKESRLDPWLAKILISEVLWGKKQLPKSDAKPIQTILAYEQAFRAHLSDSSGNTLSVKTDNYKKPRYVRINTLINPFNEALELFQDEGWTLQTPNQPNDYGRFLEQVSNLDGDFMLKDLHITDLLIFPGGTEFYNHPGYKKGALVLQDKASCFPVHILSPPPGSVVLDMCAAPGMKTTQLATMLQNEGTVYAVERDQKRFEVLNKIVASSGATCVKTINKDVLQCGDSDFPDVEYILVDPSCSASGMTDRLEVQQNQDYLRLQKLAGFQIKILRSALTRYPKARRVVYSTCSLYPEENEDVVRQVLETNNQFKLVPADNFIDKSWKNFGSADFGDIGKYCLYARPEEDLTNGFFVAVFERLEEGENNQFFNGRVLNYRKNVEQKQARKERKFKEKVADDKLENSEGKKKQDQKRSALNIDDIEIDGNVGRYITSEITSDTLKKNNNNNKRKHCDVDISDHDLENEKFTGPMKKKKNKKSEGMGGPNETMAEKNMDNSLLKSKKKKEKYSENEKFQLNGNGNKDFIANIKNRSFEDVADDNEAYLNRRKKNKRKREEFVNPNETYEETQKNTNKVISQNVEINNEDLGEKNDKPLKKSKKKKRKDDEFVNPNWSCEETEGNSNSVTRHSVDSTNENLVTKVDKPLKKSKKKKPKDGELVDLNQTYEDTQKNDNDVTKQNIRITDENLGEKIDEPLKKRKKKKRKEEEAENLKQTYKEGKYLTNDHSGNGLESISQDVAEKIIDRPLKKSKRKIERGTDIENFTPYKRGIQTSN